MFSIIRSALELSLPLLVPLAALAFDTETDSEPISDRMEDCVTPKVTATDAASITVDPRYSVDVWADQSTFTPIAEPFYVPRGITFDDTNGAYVAMRGSIYYLQDRKSNCDGGPPQSCALDVPDGEADPTPILVIDDSGSLIGSGKWTGLLYFGGRLYASRGVDNPSSGPAFLRNEVIMFADRDNDGIVDDSDGDGILSQADVIVTTDATNTHTIGAPFASPAGNKIFVSKGSYDNSTLGPFGVDPCASPITCSASILSFNLDGSDLKVSTTGLRNTYEPQFGLDNQLFGVDNARNNGTSLPEEVNRIRPGINYGFPDFEAGMPQPSEAIPIGFVEPHQGPTGSASYSYPELIQFPLERDQHFQALYGPFSPALQSPLGRSLIRLNITKIGPDTYGADPELTPDLMTGETNAFAYGFDYPIDVATNNRGDLFVVDMGDEGYLPFDESGTIYRISFNDLVTEANEFKLDRPFTLQLNGAPFAYYILFGQLDPDPGYSVDLGPRGRNGTSTLNNPIQVRTGILNASGTKNLTYMINSPAPELVGHELRFQMLRVDYDPQTQTYPANDFYIGKTVSNQITP
ncbi:MAG: hypothetical protein ACI8TQ_002464 [Planctomycetota bacterium]|jgi:hypothetical protein